MYMWLHIVYICIKLEYICDVLCVCVCVEKCVCRLASWLNTVRGPAPDAIDSFACVVTPRVLSTTTTTYVCVSPLLVDRRLNDVVRWDEVVRGYRESRRFL